MIRPIDIRLNAAHPDYPLAEAVTFTGSPSTVLVRGVPPNCGRWAITAVSVAATFPDGSTTTRAAVQSANGVWVATLPATARSGRTENGLRVMADGIDENGAAVTGYILGVADFAVASLGVTPAPEPGETSWQMLYFDAVPSTLRKGDVTKIDGVLKLYNGTAWEAFAGDIPAPSTAIPAMDGTGAAGSSAAFARGDHVHPTDTSRMAASATGADILSGRSGAPPIETITEAFSSVGYELGTIGTALSQHADDTTIHVTSTEKSTWNGKQNALSAQQLANIAAVSDALAFDATHSYAAGDPVVYDETLYTFTAAHIGAWTGNDVSAVDIIARLAGKLDKSGDTMTGSLHMGDNFLKWRNGNLIYWLSTNGLYIWNDGDDVTHSPSYIIEFPLASGTFARTADIPYNLGTPIVIDTASSETVGGETVYYGAATLANRTANIVQVTAATALDELRITFPAATNGKVRDFGLRVEIGTGSAALAAPALVPVAPSGETITIENADRAIPELADGTATAKGVTLLYFSENAPGVFVVKGEQVEEVA